MTIRKLSQYRALIRELENDNIRLRNTDENSEINKKISINCKKNIIRCQAELDTLLQFIDKIEDSEVRDIIKLKFLDGISWARIAQMHGVVGDGSTERKLVLRYLERCE